MLWKSVSFGYFGAGIVKNYCHIWNPHHQICIFAKFLEKIKMPTLLKSALFSDFWAGIVKNCHIWNQQSQIYIFAIFHQKIKMSALCKTACLLVFGLELQKIIVILEISAFKFIYFQNFEKKKKMPTLWKGALRG